VKSALSGRKCTSTTPEWPATPAREATLAGVLAIPNLAVTAPMEEGLDDDVLNVAVGHAPGTPWPGQVGTSVLLAHDVSYFANIDKLQPGDVVSVDTGCTTESFKVVGHTVVQSGAPIPQQSGNAVVLDTCWPTNALWYTPQRYLVTAVLDSTTVNKGAAKGSTPSSVAAQHTFNQKYSSTAPPELVAQGLDLSTNTQPMGTMQFAGTPDDAWAQSPAPLAVEEAGLQAFFGGLHSAAQHRVDWWSTLAPGVPMPAPLTGARVTGHGAPLNVTITATGDTPASVALDTVITLSGGAAPGTYHEHVTEAVGSGGTIVITGWEVDHA
jgi:LPXTG-site transpeptidase (sortase) family protein